MSGAVCSFCGKKEGEVERLIAGGGTQARGELPVVLICNECVQLCVDILHAPSRSASGDLHWTTFLEGDHEYEWAGVASGDRWLLVVRSVTTRKSAGWVFDTNQSLTTERARWVLNRVTPLT